jgi:dihydrodipicolinate synthase/N-acetylneuraminate lyase
MSEKRFPSCILATCVLPWDEKGQLVEELFREEIRLELRETPHLYVMGTAGEGYALSEPQFEQVVKIFSSEMKAGGSEPMVGIISMSVSEAHRRIEMAQAHGVRYFQISLPAWGPCTEAEIYTFFDEMCGRHPDCNFLHYNLLRSRVLVTPVQYRRIAQMHPNLVATKNTTDSISTLTQLIQFTPQLQHFLADVALVYGFMVGECGLLISMASCNWKLAHIYYNACKSGDFSTALDLQTDLVGMVADIRTMVEPYNHMDGGFDKMFARLHMPSFPLRLLPPYHGVPDEIFERYRRLLKEKYSRWIA